MSAVVFLGPSAPVDFAARRGLDVRPPARMGDIYRAALERPAAIGLIDGLFEHTAAVWHKEILFALSLRIPVFGGASMGALRACELDSFGMTGIGTVYEQFRSGEIADDDEVAVIHSPREDGYRVLSEAMVNIRHGLKAARDESILDQQCHDSLIAQAKDCFYPDRSWRFVYDCLSADANPSAARRLEAFIESRSFDVKRADAVAVIEAVAARVLAREQAPDPDFMFEATLYWEQGVVRGERANTAPPDVGRPSSEEERALLHCLAEREFASADQSNDIAGMLAQFRLARGLGSAARFQAWMKRHNLEPRECVLLAQREAAVTSLYLRNLEAVDAMLPIARRLDGLTTEMAGAHQERARHEQRKERT